MWESTLAKKFDKESGLLTGSGTAAIYAVLKAFNFNKDDVVLIPAICCYSVVFGVKFAGLGIEFCDIDTMDGNMDVAEAKKRIIENPKIKAVIAIHLYGNPLREIEPLAEFSKAHHVLLIEDVAQAIGTYYNNKRCGSFSDVSIFSFGYSKIITINHGGAVLTNDRHLLKQLNEINYDLPVFDEARIKMNREVFRERYSSEASQKKLNELIATEELIKNAFLFQFNNQFIDRLMNEFSGEESNYHHRREIAEIYFNSWRGAEQIQIITQPGSVPWRFTLLTKGENREKISGSIRNAGFPVSSWYPDQSAYFNETKGQSLQSARLFSEHVLNFWVDAKMDSRSAHELSELLLKTL